MRWLGALSLERLVSATMRTPLACRLRVTISPWKSLPTFLKEPMVAMSFLLLCFEPATTAASMAIYRPRTIGDAPACGPQRSGGRCRRDFLASRGMGVSPGEESLERRRCGSDDRGAAGLRSDRAIKEATCVRVLNRN